MHVLLDENVDRRLKKSFDDDFEVISGSLTGWNRLARWPKKSLPSIEAHEMTETRNLPHEMSADVPLLLE